MARQTDSVRIPLPDGWRGRVRWGVLHVISLAQFALAYTRSWAVNSSIARVRLKAENAELKQQVALLAEEIRIKDARMKRVPPQRRPHYIAVDRMAILELRAARGWSQAETARWFFSPADARRKDLPSALALWYPNGSMR